MDSNQLTQKIREQEILIKKLKDEVQLKNQCLALIAHDFVGTSRNLLWILDALENGNISYDVFHSLFPELKASIEINQKAIDSTVAWINNQHTGFKAQSVAISVFTLFSSICNFFSHDLQKKNINFRYSGDQNIIIYSDDILITFILKKVVENAIKYSYKGAEVIFHANMTDAKKIMLIIEDFGIGMDEQTLKNLFTLNGSPNTGTLNEKGTGLSLVIVNDFAKVIEGTLNISSIEKNGTQIELSLPVRLR